MALNLDQIRAIADRVAVSHGLEVVEIEFIGAVKQRALRVFIEKNAEERARLAAHTDAMELPEKLRSDAFNIDQLAFVTHEDCEQFSRDFGTVLDVEELIPGAEYTLEVSSPGLDRKLFGPRDYERFKGSLVKVQTFAAVTGNRHWQGRLVDVKQGAIVLDLSAVKQKGKAKKVAAQTVELALSNVEKANLVPEL